jgi:hypothetical protein
MFSTLLQNTDLTSTKIKTVLFCITIKLLPDLVKFLKLQKTDYAGTMKLKRRNIPSRVTE